jgi:hypothetical protein
LCHDAKRFVADLVAASGVVDRLQVVDVDQKERQGHLEPIGPADFLFEPRDEETAAREPRELVDPCRLEQVLLLSQEKAQRGEHGERRKKKVSIDLGPTRHVIRDPERARQASEERAFEEDEPRRSRERETRQRERIPASMPDWISWLSGTAHRPPPRTVRVV